MSNAVATGWPSGSGNLGWGQEPTAMLMPGRVQGWPAGTQRAANPATQLLTQAVAYWDVAQYRDGDRFLRNRGTGGDLLDLRLGSSIVANSNDPLFLPVADEGYVYLTGVAGNSLSVTAPATATNYIAYPLDRSASTATGAVTGGATFTFSTTGSWRLIELLDASNVVVDTIDCDAITSGSATSFTSGIVNQTININRSTSGRKAVAVPSRSKGGSPLFLHGTDDWFTPDQLGNQNTHRFMSLANNVLDASQRCPDRYTIIGVARVWPDSAPFALMQQALGAGGSTIGTSAGGAFGLNTGLGATCTPRLAMRNNAITLTDGPTAGMGSLVVAAATVVRDNAREIKTVYTNGVAGTPNTTNSGPDALETSPGTTFVGAATAAAGHSGEFYALAYFRRALSADEITRLSNYFTGRIA